MESTFEGIEIEDYIVIAGYFIFVLAVGLYVSLQKFVSCMPLIENGKFLSCSHHGRAKETQSEDISWPPEACIGYQWAHHYSPATSGQAIL